MASHSNSNQEMTVPAAEQPSQTHFPAGSVVGGTQQHLAMIRTDAAAEPWLGRLSQFLSNDEKRLGWLFRQIYPKPIAYGKLGTIVAISSFSMWSEREIGIPAEVIKHVTAYIDGRQGQNAVRLPVTDAMREIPRRDILPRTSLRDTLGRALNDNDQVQRLPDELLCMVKSCLEPADAVCLALASKGLFKRLNYQLTDVKNARNSCFGRHPTMRPCQTLFEQQVFDVTKRLDDDRVQKLISHAPGLEALQSDGRFASLVACRACRKLHPFDLFSKKHINRRPDDRVCLAAEAKLPVGTGDTWAWDLMELRKLRERKHCYGQWLDTRPLVDYQTPGIRTQHTASIHDTASRLSIQRTYELFTKDKRELLDRRLDAEYREEVKGRLNEIDGQSNMCPHMRTSQSNIMDAFDVEPDFSSTVWSELRDMKSKCDTCGTTWHFQETTDYDRSSSTNILVALNLVVSEQLPKLDDQWSQDWLVHVEGGMELMAMAEASYNQS